MRSPCSNPDAFDATLCLENHFLKMVDVKEGVRCLGDADRLVTQPLADALEREAPVLEQATPASLAQPVRPKVQMRRKRLIMGEFRCPCRSSVLLKLPPNVWAIPGDAIAIISRKGVFRVRDYLRHPQIGFLRSRRQRHGSRGTVLCNIGRDVNLIALKINVLTKQGTPFLEAQSGFDSENHPVPPESGRDRNDLLFHLMRKIVLALYASFDVGGGELLEIGETRVFAGEPFQLLRVFEHLTQDTKLEPDRIRLCAASAPRLLVVSDCRGINIAQHDFSKLVNATVEDALIAHSGFVF